MTEPLIPPAGGDPLPGVPEGADIPSDGNPVLLTIIVKPFRVEPVLQALAQFRVHSLTTTEVRGYGRQKGHLELYKGSEYAISFIPKIKIEVAVPAGEVEELIRAVSRAARTGRIGDGKIFLQGAEMLSLDPDDG